MRRTLAIALAVAAVLSFAPVVAAEMERVAICHVPPGNADAARTIAIGSPAAEEHMGEHSDSYSPCDIDEAPESPGDEGNPGSGTDDGADDGTNPDEGQEQGPTPSAVAGPATWLWLLLVAIVGGAVATAYVLRRRRIGSR